MLALLQALERAARDAGVIIRYGCTAERLLVGGTGAVEGVEIRAESGSLETINAHAVVLASGGFAGNGEMLAQHLGPGAESLAPISPGTRFSTGDGIRMALAAGAQAAGDWRGMHAEPVDPRSRNSAPVVLVYPYGIVVDSTGRRFFDEGAGLVHETWETFARTIHFATPGRIAYAILDAKLYDIDGYQRAIRSEVPPHQAATIPELAALIGVPADGASRTPSRATTRQRPAIRQASMRHALDGLAADAGLSPPKSNWCRPLDRPPYLAYPLIGAIAYTFGGIATNAMPRCWERAAPFPACSRPARSPGTSMAPRPMRSRCCEPSYSGALPGPAPSLLGRGAMHCTHRHQPETKSASGRVWLGPFDQAQLVVNWVVAKSAQCKVQLAVRCFWNMRAFAGFPSSRSRARDLAVGCTKDEAE